MEFAYWLKLFEGFIIHSVVGKQVKRFGGEVCGKGGVGLFHIMGLTHKGVIGQTCSETDSPINLLKNIS